MYICLCVYPYSIYRAILFLRLPVNHSLSGALPDRPAYRRRRTSIRSGHRVRTMRSPTYIGFLYVPLAGNKDGGPNFRTRNLRGHLLGRSRPGRGVAGLPTASVLEKLADKSCWIAGTYCYVTRTRLRLLPVIIPIRSSL